MKTVKNMDDLLLILRQKNVFNEYGLKRIGVFGSMARGEKFHDIDLFIEDDIELKQAFRLKKSLEAASGVSVDIMLKQYAEPVILYRALKEMKYASAYKE
jgi:predicted nucleotidyltransferase